MMNMASQPVVAGGRLAGKVAIVTGGSMGIGEATVKLLCSRGARVIIADIAEEQGLELAESLRGKAAFCRCDVTKEEDISATIKFAEETFGPLFLFVNNAGISGAACSLDDMTVAKFENTMRINLLSALIGTKLAARAGCLDGVLSAQLMVGRTSRSSFVMLRAIREAKIRGAIVNVASAAGLRGGLGSVDYACSKAGMLLLTQQAACELAGDGIRVNSVAPSFVSTPMTQALLGGDGDSDTNEVDVDAKLSSVSAFKGHVANAEDVANAIVFLASPDALACTGINILVDTGLMTGIGGRLPVV